jgi:hypothetical protein
MGAVHLLPGTTFSDVKQKGCYPSEARAILTISELERRLALQIAGVLSTLAALLSRHNASRCMARSHEPAGFARS